MIEALDINIDHERGSYFGTSNSSNNSTLLRQVKTSD
jgi:hypothetical protein